MRSHSSRSGPRGRGPNDAALPVAPRIGRLAGSPPRTEYLVLFARMLTKRMNPLSLGRLAAIGRTVPRVWVTTAE